MVPPHTFCLSQIARSEPRLLVSVGTLFWHDGTRRGSTDRSTVPYRCTIDVRTPWARHGVPTGPPEARWDPTDPRRTPGGTVGPRLIGASPVWAARSSYWRSQCYCKPSPSCLPSVELASMVKIRLDVRRPVWPSARSECGTWSHAIISSLGARARGRGFRLRRFRVACCQTWTILDSDQSPVMSHRDGF